VFFLIILRVNILSLTFVFYLTKIVYVTQRNEFVTQMIVNVAMLTRLDKNVSKNINVNNFFVGKKCQYFFIGEKCQ